MREISRTLEKIIAEPLCSMSRNEARGILRRCGIIDENGNITPAYSKIVTYKTKHLTSKQPLGK